MSSFFTTLPSIPSIKPAFNVGAGFDIPTGQYHIGIHGESILNGGMQPIVSIAGPGNSFKSVICLFWNMSVADRIKQFQFGEYDSETSLSYNRINVLAQRFPNLRVIEHGDASVPLEDMKIMITSAVEMLGDEYFELIKTISENKRKDKNGMLTTPFLDHNDKFIKVVTPTGVAIDSLSELTVTSNEEKIVDKNVIGDSANNVLYMRQGIAKKQLMTQLPRITGSSGMFFTLVAHVGEEFDIGGMMAPKKHKLTYAKKGSKVIGTTGAFNFLNNALYEIFSVNSLNNKEYGTGVLYPLLDADKDKDCTDLLKVHLKLTRNKSGPSGACIDLIVSQREGVLAHLSQFDYIKEHDRFGLVGNNTSYALALLPEVKLMRTTVRGIIDTMPKLQRALEITSELLQIKTLWSALPDDLMCSPGELYGDLAAMGYNWDILLNTRGYWVFEENTKDELPFLSTLDLLKMRKNMYYPYFLHLQDKTKYHHEFKHMLTQS